MDDAGGRIAVWLAVIAGLLALARSAVRGLIALGRLTSLVATLEVTLATLDHRIDELEAARYLLDQAGHNLTSRQDGQH